MTIPVAKTAYNKKQAETYDVTRFTTRAGQQIHQLELANLLTAMKGVTKDSRVVEIGCGTGRLLKELCRRGYQVDGMDASPEMLAQCQRKLQDRFPEVELRLGEAGKTPYSDDHYDLVYSIRTLNQTGSPEYALDAVGEMIRIAKSGGHVLVEFVNYYRPRLARNKTRSTRLTPKQVVERAKRCGAERVWYRGAFFFGMTALQVSPQFLIGWLSAIDRGFSRLFPRLCSRCYVLLRKQK